MYSVYKHTCPNGKIYIGITSREPKERWNSGYGYRTNQHFWNAIQKYGWKNIKHEILYEDLSEQEAYNLEIQLIAKYDTTNPDKGYNHSTGGECITSGVKFSEEHRKRISEKLKGRTLSEETKLKLSRVNKGTRGDRVQCVETGKIYRNAQQAQEETGIHFKSIQRAASGYYQTAGNLHWKFVDVDKRFIVDVKNKRGLTVTF